MSQVGFRRHMRLLAREGRETTRRSNSMSSSFATPAPPSGGLDYKDLNGSLILVEVLGVEDHVPTVHTKPGEKSPAVRADVYVLDGNGAGEEFKDTLVFPRVLQSQLKRSVGEKVLGRLGQGVAKPAQDPPWILNEASADDIAKAEAWVAQNAKPAVTSAAPPF